MVGVNENQLVPYLEGEYAHLAVQNAERAWATARQNRNQTGDDSMNQDQFVNMIVIDGIVVGPTVSKLSLLII